MNRENLREVIVPERKTVFLYRTIPDSKFVWKKGRWVEIDVHADREKRSKKTFSLLQRINRKRNRG